MMRVFLFFCMFFYSHAVDIFEMHEYEASFVQKITNDNNSTIRYEGKLYIKGDDKALWEYKNPINKFIYINGEFVVIIEPELEQVLLRKFSKQPNFVSMLKNTTKVDDEHFIATFGEIEYTLFIKDDVLVSISYTDKLDNKVVISFKDQKINHNIDNSIFVYTIPEDYDIL